MYVREKLVHLVKNALRAYGKDLEKTVEPFEFIADFLISNGVTVQEWIPVTERLPEVKRFVLVYDEINGVCLDYRDGDSFGYCEVTHWMPLPEKPKGE